MSKSEKRNAISHFAIGLLLGITVGELVASVISPSGKLIWSGLIIAFFAIMLITEIKHEQEIER